MKFAVVSGQRREAAASLSGYCPLCAAPVIAKCGELRAWHWAHRARRSCDRWWENETDWHRGWKNDFPADWLEIVHIGADGEKHIADVKTVRGTVLEFQHSPLASAERRAREDFYRDMVWVVDALRRRRDRSAFFSALPSRGASPLPGAISAYDSALVRDWSGCKAPVYFDFGDAAPLWRLQPGSRDGMGYVIPVARSAFVQAHLQGEALEAHLTALVGEALHDRARRAAGRAKLEGFERYTAQQDLQRRRY